MKQEKETKKIVYLKADLNVIISNPVVLLSDIVKMYSTDKELVTKLRQEVIFKVTEPKTTKYAITILKLIEAIQEKYPEVIVSNEGESDIVVEYIKPGKEKKIREILKTVFVSLTVFFGSAFTIMTFNQDVSVKEVLGLFHHLVMGDSSEGIGIIEVFYSIGLPIGIIVFFNHFSKIKMDTDPTPLQVQLRLYEANESKAIIGNANREGKKIDVS